MASSEGVTGIKFTVESRLKSRSYAAWSTLCDLSERGVAARTVYTSALRPDNSSGTSCSGRGWRWRAGAALNAAIIAELVADLPTRHLEGCARSRKRGRRSGGCQHDYRVRFVTAAELVTLLVEAQQQGRLARKLAQVARLDVVHCDELGYVPARQGPGRRAVRVHQPALRAAEPGGDDEPAARALVPRSSSTRRRPPRSSPGSATTRRCRRPRAAASGWAAAKQNQPPASGKKEGRR